MKRIFITLFALIALAFAPNALATTTATTCPTQAADAVSVSSWSVVEGGEATVGFTVSPACTNYTVSLVSYQAPLDHFTLESSPEQTVYDYKTRVLAPGSYTLSVRVPACFYQVDFVQGEVIEHFGTAWDDHHYTRAQMIRHENAGSTACLPAAPPTPPVDVCTNLAGAQAVIPTGYVKRDGKCVRAAHYAPRASVQGPCGDPWYRAVFNNRHSNRAVTFRFSYVKYGVGRVTLTRTVAAHKRVLSRYVHVLGYSRMTIRARGHVLFNQLAAAPGNYAPCQ